MAWDSYNLDREAQELVFKYRNSSEALQQSYKMRSAVAFGLERFWGEQLRLSGDKEKIWSDTWLILQEILHRAKINLPTKDASPEELWNFPIQQRKIALAILTQLCDAIVWWTQRYKKADSNSNGEDNG
ncbi:hypothetical protein HC928_15185 [bacterium]|nr:hypothetical protein [bacterium]